MGKVCAFDSAPLVSVIMCVYNGEKQVARAVDDILSQTYQNFELIISDDASTDETSKILERYRGNRRVRLFRQPVNQGFIANKNFAIGKARGSLITQQDHDDRSDTTRLERQVKALADTGMLIVACGVRRINQWGDEVTRFAPEHDMVIDSIPESGLPFFFAPTMFRRAIWEQHGPFNEYFAGAFGEDNYFISCVLRSHPIALIADCLYEYADTPGSVTSRIRTQRALTMAPILHLLAKQNKETGTNELEQGNLEFLETQEKLILSDRSYVAEQYRVYAARAIDHGQFSEAVALIRNAATLNPLSIKLARTAVYFLRKAITRTK